MIESAIEGHLERSSHLHQLACAFYIDSAIFAEHTQHHAARAQQAQMLQVFAHNIEFRIGIDEIATTRTQQHMHGQPTTIYGFANQAMTRRQSAFTERTAKLNTVCSTVSRDETCVDTLST